MADSVVKYAGIADIKQFWLENIAPNYFNLEDTNLYQMGIFGFINEVMAETTEDAFNAVNIARREFYPITAQFKKTLYKMATMQKIELPMATPATCRAALIVPEKEITDNATFDNGVYTCVLDNTMKLLAADVPFVIDFPIIVISKKDGNGWIHTCHYDTSVSNSLQKSSSKYIVNKVLNQNGIRYLALFVSLRQVEVVPMDKPIMKDTTLETITLDFGFSGDLANFEVFYKENDATPDVQLKKVQKNGTNVQTPFCKYEIFDQSIRLYFVRNAYFNPAFNSIVTMYIYTSYGSKGNFPGFTGSLVSQLSSERYPYNNNMTITGIIDGACTGGADKATDEGFRQQIIDAYSTNNTITTANDLQVYFNRITKNRADNSGLKVLFRKKRDDALIRLFGAYCLVKDQKQNVIPTNTLQITLKKSELTSYQENANRVTIKTGTLFEYKPNNGTTIVYDAQKVTDLTLMDDLASIPDTRFIFTNPFLIGITLNPNIIGFYSNSLNVTKTLEYTYVNDATIVQFIASSLKMDRNALIGENYYRISVNLSPSSELDPALLAIDNDDMLEENRIRAAKNGKIISSAYDATKKGIFMTIKYSDDTTSSFQINNTVEKTTEGTFIYKTGFTPQFNVGDSVVTGDVLGIKNDTDLGRIRLALDIRGTLFENQYYIPMTIEHYNKADNVYECAGYISTGDLLNVNGTLLIEHGILDLTGTENDNVTIPMEKVYFNIHAFFRNDEFNYDHIYSKFDYYKGWTLTNTYSLNTESEDSVSFIQKIDFIRSMITFHENTTDPSAWTIDIDEMPVIQANWVKNPDNMKYFTSQILQCYKDLYVAYFLLENNYGIDLKFYNSYGKSRFFRIGLKDETQILDRVNCSMSFGVHLTSFTPAEIFLQKFRDYIKTYIESINSMDNNEGQSIYILNLTNSVCAAFPEIGYMEYYGINSFDYRVQKIISMSTAELLSQGITGYIPEFVNIRTVHDKGQIYPNIDVRFLDS